MQVCPNACEHDYHDYYFTLALHCSKNFKQCRVLPPDTSFLTKLLQLINFPLHRSNRPIGSPQPVKALDTSEPFDGRAFTHSTSGVDVEILTYPVVKDHSPPFAAIPHRVAAVREAFLGGEGSVANTPLSSSLQGTLFKVFPQISSFRPRTSPVRTGLECFISNVVSLMIGVRSEKLDLFPVLE